VILEAPHNCAKFCRSMVSLMTVGCLYLKITFHFTSLRPTVNSLAVSLPVITSP